MASPFSSACSDDGGGSASADADADAITEVSDDAGFDTAEVGPRPDVDGGGDDIADAPDAQRDGEDDTADGAIDTRDAGDEPETDGGEPVVWDRSVPAAREFAAPENFRWARSIIHLHSTHSHDACDGNPRVDDDYNWPCWQSLRLALCAARIDHAYLTDHPTHFVEVPFEDLMLHEEGDELLRDELDRPYANRITCPDGFVVTIRPGAEDELMPVGMREHVPGDAEERNRTMNARTPEAVAAMRATGALIWQAHVEERGLEILSPVGLDGLEIYQLHANLDPESRALMGLDPFAPIADLFPFLSGTAVVHPDLALLAFLVDNQPSLDRWGALLQEAPITGSGGTDAHENTFPGIAGDGERLDSYRRMMSWFSNNLLVTDDTPEAADEALRNGRSVVVFDVFGPLDGLDVWLDDGVTRHEVGASVPSGDALVLRGTVPRPTGPTGLPATVRGLVLRAVGEGWSTVAELEPGEFAVALEGDGAYRLEVRTTAAHFGPLLAEFAGFADREYPWIYTNAFRVGLPTPDR